MTTRRLLLTAVSALAFGPARAFALKSVVDSLDDVPEALHAEYVSAGGKFVLQVEGMKTQADFDRLQGAHTKEKQEHGALKQRFESVFGQRKFEDIVADLDRLPELEAAAKGKLDDAAINDIVEGRVKTRIAPVERERDQLKNKIGELEGTVQQYTTKEKQRKIHDKAREAATAAKLLPEAIDDFLLLADTVFEVREDDGKVVVKDQVGFTPGVEPGVLLTDLQSKRPHWWGPSAGGGAGGNRSGTSANSNPWSAQNWNMTEQGRIINSDPAKAEQLARAAGHADPLTARKPAAAAQ